MVTPWRVIGWNPKSWRFGSDDFPDLNWLVLRFQMLILRGVNLQPFKGTVLIYIYIYVQYLLIEVSPMLPNSEIEVWTKRMQYKP